MITSYLISQINLCSSLSQNEYIELKATLLVLHNERFQCEKCLTEFKGLKDCDERTEKNRILKACRQKSRESRFAIDEFKYFLCPGNFFSNSAMGIVSMFNYFSKNHLPFDGPISEQPNKIIECFNVIQNYEVRQEAEERKKEARKQIGNRKSIR